MGKWCPGSLNHFLWFRASSCCFCNLLKHVKILRWLFFFFFWCHCFLKIEFTCSMSSSGLSCMKLASSNQPLFRFAESPFVTENKTPITSGKGKETCQLYALSSSLATPGSISWSLLVKISLVCMKTFPLYTGTHSCQVDRYGNHALTSSVSIYLICHFSLLDDQGLLKQQAAHRIR